MAIDSLRKRASIASLGLAFLAPSVVPDGSFAVGDRQAIAHSYYGIAAGNPSKTIGGTSQLEVFTSTGTLTVQPQHTIGATSQLEAFDSTGQINLGWQIGGTSQLEAFTSSGTIQAGTARKNTGGFFYAVDDLLTRQRRRNRERYKREAEAERISDELTRLVAIEERRIEAESDRILELNELTDLASSQQNRIEVETDARIRVLAKRAIEKKTFSAMEHFERELFKFREEEEFIILATQILVNNQ